MGRRRACTTFEAACWRRRWSLPGCSGTQTSSPFSRPRSRPSPCFPADGDGRVGVPVATVVAAVVVVVVIGSRVGGKGPRTAAGAARTPRGCADQAAVVPKALWVRRTGALGTVLASARGRGRGALPRCRPDWREAEKHVYTREQQSGPAMCVETRFIPLRAFSLRATRPRAAVLGLAAPYIPMNGRARS